MNRKTLFSAMFLAVLVAFSPPSYAAPKYIMKFASFASKGSSWARAQEAFKKYLEEGTKGQVELRIFNNNSLGTNREVLEMAKLGTVDFTLTGAGHVTRHVPQLGALLLPFLWKDTKTMYEVLDGPVREYLDELYQAKGFKLMGWWDNGFRHVSNSKRPIKRVADMKGLKLRTLPAKVHVAFFRALGASPTPMGWAEVVPALRQGVIDGQENPPGIIYFFKLYEVQKYYSFTSHVNEPLNVLMSKAVYDKLPKDIQFAVKVAFRRAELYQREINQKDNVEVISKIRATGMKLNEVPEETMAEFRKIAQSVYPQAIKDFGPGGQELVEQLILSNK